MGGLAGGDAECQNAADDEGLGGTWTAWLSDKTGNAKNRIADHAYYKLNGQKVADDLDDLIDGNIDSPINISEKNTVLDGRQVWTGTGPQGNNRISLTEWRNSCLNWTEDDEDPNGVYGRSNYTDDKWTQRNNSGDDCDNNFRLYCFEQ